MTAAERALGLAMERAQRESPQSSFDVLIRRIMKENPEHVEQLVVEDLTRMFLSGEKPPLAPTP